MDRVLEKWAEEEISAALIAYLCKIVTICPAMPIGCRKTVVHERFVPRMNNDPHIATLFRNKGMKKRNKAFGDMNRGFMDGERAERGEEFARKCQKC